MNIYKAILLLLIVFSGGQVMSQEISLSQAIQNYQNKNLGESKKIIDALANQTETTTNPNYWYLKGFIYKDLYKANPNTDSAIYFRSTSLKSFEQLLKMSEEAQYVNDAHKNITYIATTFYNDAITKMNQNSIEQAEYLFNRYKNSIAPVEMVTIDKEINFYLALATRATNISRQVNQSGDKYFKQAVDIYERVLSLDKNNVKANYNLAVLFYNRAVNLISNLEVDEIDLISFSEIEDRSIVLFKQSLPYMQHAYELNPDDKNTIEGLAGIYFSLREFEKSEHYKNMMQ